MWVRFRLVFAFLVLALGLSCIHQKVSVGRLPSGVACVAVTPFEIRFDPNASEEILSEFLSLDLARQGLTEPMGPMEVLQFFEDAGETLPPSIDPFWAKKIGERTGADAVIFGSIVQIPVAQTEQDEELRMRLDVDAYLLHLKSGDIRWTYSAKDWIDLENYTARLSAHSSKMVAALLEKFEATSIAPDHVCWKATHGVQPSHPPTAAVQPKPKTPPAMVLTAAQKKLMSELKTNGKIILQPSTFEARSAHLQKDAVLILWDLAVVIQHLGEGQKIQIGAHLDATNEGAQDLMKSKARAETIKRYLMTRGVEEGSLAASGYGGSQPKMPNINERMRNMNRRTEIVLLP